MTREQKLSLIMGFALVLAVGVLLSDHLAGANRAGSASPEVMGDSTEIARDYGEPPALSLNAVGHLAQAAGARAGDALKDRIEQAATAPDYDAWIQNTHPVAQREAKTLALPPATEVPSITMGQPQQAEDAAPERSQAPAGVKTYTVEKNDTLWGIAQRFYGDGALHQKLAAYNDGRTGQGGALYAGATLLIPPASDLGAAPARVADARRAEPVAAPAKPKTQGKAVRFYTVRKNDTLSQIAQRELGTIKRMDDILSLNGDKIDSPDDIWVGLKLKLPST